MLSNIIRKLSFDVRVLANSTTSSTATATQKLLNQEYIDFKQKLLYQNKGNSVHPLIFDELIVYAWGEYLPVSAHGKITRVSDNQAHIWVYDRHHAPAVVQVLKEAGHQVTRDFNDVNVTLKAVDSAQVQQEIDDWKTQTIENMQSLIENAKSKINQQNKSQEQKEKIFGYLETVLREYIANMDENIEEHLA